MRISDWSSDVCSSDLARCNSQLSRLIHRRSENGIIQSDTAALISATGKREAPRSSRRSTATRSLRRALARLRGDHCLRSEHVDLAFAREKRLDHGAGGGVENDCRPFALERNGLDRIGDRKSTRLTSSHSCASRMPSSACKKKTHKTQPIYH